MIKTDRIPWARLTAEGGAIVVSILLAFWVDAWWDNRSQQIALEEDLRVLKQEISRNLLEIDEVLDSIDKTLERLDKVLRILADSRLPVLPASFTKDVAAIYSLPQSYMTNNAFDVMLSPANLRQIDNSELRLNIVRTDKSIRDVDTLFSMLAKEYAEQQGPFLVRHFVVSDFGWYEEDQGLDQSELSRLQRSGMVRSVPESQFGLDHDAMRSREFWNLLYHWRAIYLDYADSLLYAKEEHQKTLELLDREIS